MRICLKKSLKIGVKTLQKHTEGFLISVEWQDKGEFYYLVDFGKEGTHTVESSDCDILNCR